MRKIKFLNCAVMAAFMALGLASCEEENFNTDTNVSVTPPTINIPGLPESYKPGDAVVSITPTVNALINGEITKVTAEATIKFGNEEAKYKVITGQTIAAQEITISVSYTANVEGFEKVLEATDVVSVPALEAGMVAIITPTIWLSANAEGYIFHKVGDTEIDEIADKHVVENTSDYWYSDYTAVIPYVREGSYVTNKYIMPGYEDDPEVIEVFNMYADGLSEELVYDEFHMEDLTVFAESQTVIHFTQVKISTDYEIHKEMTWSRSTEVKTVAKFTVEQYGAFKLDDIVYNVSLEGEGHGHGGGHGHGHGHGGNDNAGGSIVDPL